MHSLRCEYLREEIEESDRMNDTGIDQAQSDSRPTIVNEPGRAHRARYRWPRTTVKPVPIMPLAFQLYPRLGLLPERCSSYGIAGEAAYIPHPVGL